MSTTPPTPPTPPQNKFRPHGDQSITIVSHSSLFYWWPVWAIGFIFALWTLVENTRFIHVPPHTKTELVPGGGVKLIGDKSAGSGHDAAQREMVERYADDEKYGERKPPRMSRHAGMGTVYCIVLLIVISITNVPLRGLWSVIVIVVIVLLSVIFWVADWWEPILGAVGNLHVYIGFAGYLFLSTVLFVMWAVSTMVIDRRVYMVFTPGQFKVCEEVGGGEQTYDTMGMSIEKHRDDLFRHWVLGLGSGDLTVRTTGAQIHTFTMPNVLFVGRKLQQIEDMQREKQTVQG
jgi:hypothetical protein